LTEQGLPDFLSKCASMANEACNNFVEDAIHLGSTRIQGSSAKGKIDTYMTFNLPVGDKTKKISQGISVKSNYLGMQANILSTTFAQSLKYGNFLGSEP